MTTTSTSSDFDRALTFSLAWEGGWSNHPADRGGPTACGITLAAARDYGVDLDGDGDTDIADLKKIPMETVKRIYYERYWLVSHANECPWPLCAVVFDAAVNSGPERSIRWLQAALGCGRDGIFGEHTRFAVERSNPTALALKTLALREQMLRRFGTGDQAAFLAGWLNRINALRALVEGS